MIDIEKLKIAIKKCKKEREEHMTLKEAIQNCGKNQIYRESDRDKFFPRTDDNYTQEEVLAEDWKIDKESYVYYIVHTSYLQNGKPCPAIDYYDTEKTYKTRFQQLIDCQQYVILHYGKIPFKS